MWTIGMMDYMLERNAQRQRSMIWQLPSVLVLLSAILKAQSFMMPRIRQTITPKADHQHHPSFKRLRKCNDPHPPSIRTRLQQLFGIPEWRDLIFEYPGTGDDRRLGTDQGGLPKEVCILPFPYQEVLLQGETKQLRLYEERFIKLFDDCMEHHCGVVAMGMIASSGIIKTVPLAEIEAYNRLEGFGIFVTIRVVGRAKLLEVVQQEPYIKAVCTELTDTLPPNLEL
jgi:hypothetical protein